MWLAAGGAEPGPGRKKLQKLLLVTGKPTSRLLQARSQAGMWTCLRAAKPMQLLLQRLTASSCVALQK